VLTYVHAFAQQQPITSKVRGARQHQSELLMGRKDALGWSSPSHDSPRKVGREFTHRATAIRPYFDVIGYMSGGEYARLMRLLTYKETQARTSAFQVYGEPYFPSFMWRPTPVRGRPYSLAKTRMHHETHMRW
jgi:hypothetical protein